jgi:hypothetical protein
VPVLVTFFYMTYSFLGQGINFPIEEMAMAA